MSITNLGNVAVKPRGEWSNATQYYKNDLVGYLGSMYLAKSSPEIATVPTDTSYWMLSASKGDNTTASNVALTDTGGYYTGSDTEAVLQEVGSQLADIAPEYGNRFARALGTLLMSGVTPACLLCQGDSTTVNTTGWFYLAMQWLASLFMAYTAKYRLWNDTNQAYGAPTILQTGANGDGYVLLPGDTTSKVSAPDSAALSITGDIDIRLKFRFDGYVGAIYPSLLTKNSYWLALTSVAARNLVLYWVDSGGTIRNAQCTTALFASAPTEDLTIRVTLDVDNGASGRDIKFYTSTDDGATWVQLGSTITQAGTTSIKDEATSLVIGNKSVGADGYWSGRVYWAEVRNGIDGKIVASPDFGMAFPTGITSFKDAEGNTWTVGGNATVGNGSPCLLALNASVSGKKLDYATAGIAVQSAISPQLAFINFGHNETTNLVYQAACEAFAASFLSANPSAGVVFVAQNPQKDSETNIYEYPANHAYRNAQVATAAAKGDYGLVDLFRAYLETDGWEDYINADGVHPLDAGHATIALPAVKRFLAPAVPRS